MGLVNRVVPAGTARTAAVAWAHELAALPQVCLRNDRLVGAGAVGPTEEDALRHRGPVRAGQPGVAASRSTERRASRPGPAAGAARLTTPPTESRDRRCRRRRRLRLRRHPDRRRERLRLPDRGLRGRSAVVTATAALAPRLAQAALAGGTAGRRGQGAAVRAGPGRGGGRRGSRPARQRFARAPPATAPARRRAASGSTGTGTGATGWSSCRRHPRSTSARPVEHLGVDGVVATRLALDGGGTAHRPLRGGQLPGRGEAPSAAARGCRDTGAEPDRLWAYGNSRGDLRLLRRRRRRGQRGPAGPAAAGSRA